MNLKDKKNTNATIMLPSGAWHGDDYIYLSFPEGWQVYQAYPVDAPLMPTTSLDDAFANPIGSEPLHRLASGKDSAVVAIDDITRPTPTNILLPRILHEIVRGGIPMEKITILIGGASHRSMSSIEMAKKLGNDCIANCKTVMHNFEGNDVQYVGWVNGGPVYLNRHFLAADLKICVGSVFPNRDAGFGGGAKMVIPGIAGRLSIAHFHGALPNRPAGKLEPEKGICDRRKWAEDVARFIGVDAVICAVVNSRRQLAGLYVGDVVKAHRGAAIQSMNIGRTIIPTSIAEKADIILLNCYPLDTSPVMLSKALLSANQLKPKTNIIVSAASDGIYYHGMGTKSSRHRIIYNLSRLLFSPESLIAIIRGMNTAIRNCRIVTTEARFRKNSNHKRSDKVKTSYRMRSVAKTIARLGYYSLSHIPYNIFQKKDRETKDIDIVRYNPQCLPDPMVFSKNFPSKYFKQKYTRGFLYRDWSDLLNDLDKNIRRGRVIILPCAPLQVIELID